jgi:hypothetical protein
LSLSLTSIPSKDLIQIIIPAVTHILSTVVTQAVTRDGQDDYFCHYCTSTNTTYCEACEASKVLDADKLVSSSHFANFYSRYYTHYYEGYIADKVIEDYHIGYRVVNSEKGKEEKKE